MQADYYGRRKPPIFLVSILRLSSLFGLVVLGACLFPLAAQAVSKTGSYTEVEVFSYSQPVPVKAALNDWLGPFYGGSTALLYSRVEAGVAGQHWRFGLLSRMDYQLHFSPDAAEFYHRVSNKQALDAGRTYAIEVESKHFFGNGLRLGYLFTPQPGLTLELGMSYLQGQRLTTGTLSGTATATKAGDYEFNLAADYFYSRDVLFRRETAAPDGQGYSADLRVQWQASPRLSTQLTVTDLIGRIYWQDAPYTQASGTSDTKEYDEQGYVRFKPLVSGIEGNRNHTQKLPPRAILAAQYLLDRRFSALASVFYTEYRTFPSLGLGYQDSGIQWQGLYNSASQSYTLRAIANRWRIGASLDTFDINRARALGVELQFQQLF